MCESSSRRVKIPFVPFQISHFAFLGTESGDPTEALESEESIDWKKAMDEESSSHHKNNTWELVRLPENCKAVAGKWVLTQKTNGIFIA